MAASFCLRQLGVFLILFFISFNANGQKKNYYVSMPKDSGVLLFINPVEFSVVNKNASFLADFTVNYFEKEKDTSYVVMNFSFKSAEALVGLDSVAFFFKNKVDSDLLIPSKKIYLEDRGKKWESRYSCELSLKEFVEFLNHSSTTTIKLISESYN